jgi:hypothetical protein
VLIISTLSFFRQSLRIFCAFFSIFTDSGYDNLKQLLFYPHPNFGASRISFLNTMTAPPTAID